MSFHTGLIFFIITFATGNRSKWVMAHLKAYCVAFHSSTPGTGFRHLAQCQQRLNVVDPKNPAVEFSAFGLTAPDPLAMPVSSFFLTRAQHIPTIYQKLNQNSGASGHQISQTVLAIFGFFFEFSLPASHCFEYNFCYCRRKGMYDSSNNSSGDLQYLRFSGNLFCNCLARCQIEEIFRKGDFSDFRSKFSPQQPRGLFMHVVSVFASPIPIF